MKLHSILLVLVVLHLSSAFASSIKPAPIGLPTPTIPSRETIGIGQALYSPAQIAKFHSVAFTFIDKDGEKVSFIQIKEGTSDYKIYLTDAVYHKLKADGVEVDHENIEVISEGDYENLLNQTELKTTLEDEKNGYLGGEAGRCVAGTIGGALGGAVAGSMGGAVGAIAGAVGGALMGSAASCK